MKLLRGFEEASTVIHTGTAITIGNFDGVHLGHRSLLKNLREKASQMKLATLVILFEPQPSEYFHPRHSPTRITSLREKIAVLSDCGIDYVCCIKFDHDVASMLAHEFASKYIFSMLRANYLLIGEDFRFGKNRSGDVKLLQELGKDHSCIVEQFSDFFIDHQRVSSTIIRQALQQGHLSDAAKFLGRPYSMCGRVVHGDGLGKQWGIPTANLRLHRDTLALNGVYCVQVRLESNVLVMGVANIGSRPTINGKENRLEVHLFDFDQSLYGMLLQVIFLNKLRDEKQFASMDALIAQIHEDIMAAKAYCERISL